jgi:SAM-dependent methyltransferase
MIDTEIDTEIGAEIGTEPATGDAYAALAAIYDDWQERHGAFWKLALPRLRAALGAFPPPADAPPAFLDLGCGTGELVLALGRLEPGWRLCGLDASAAMLALARRKAGAASVRWVHGSFDAEVEGGFTAAGAFFDALNHAVAPGALASACAAAARALVPGGLFAFDLNNEAGFRAWWHERQVFVGPGWTLTMEARFDPDARLAHGRAIVDDRRPGGGRRITEVVECCFGDDEVAAALEQAGFSVACAEPWSPARDGVPGKTWWVARRR